MIQNRVYRLRQPAEIEHGLNFKGGEEFHIVSDMVYMQGHPLPPELQNFIYTWIIQNPKLFIDDTRQF